MSLGERTGVVLVFRLQMFKPSETFIAAQAGAMTRYRPVYVGWRLHGRPPPGRAFHPARTWMKALRLFALGDAGKLRHDITPGATVIHAHFGVDAVFAMALSRRLHAPLVVTLHGFDVSRRWRSLLLSRRPALLGFLIGWRALTRRADLFLAVSSSVAAAALRRGAPADRLRRHVIGVDVEQLQPEGCGEPGLIVQVGRLVEKKGAHLTIQALRRLEGRCPNARLVLVGDGPLRRWLEADVARLGLGHRVRLTGALAHTEALAWMRRAAVVAVPSVAARNGDAEGLTSVLLEAAALGRPIVASDASGAAEIFDHGAHALIVPAANPFALGEALHKLLEQPALAAALGRAARRRVEADLDLRRQSEALEVLYDRLLAERRLAAA